MAFFSVVIPLFNKESHIENTLKSVFSQTFQDFEIIIVNDGSTDKSLETVSAFKDQRIRIFTTENKGVSHARNYGIEKSSSDLIVFLDADDYWLPHHLEDLKTLYDKLPNCGLYAKAYSSIKKGVTIKSVFKDTPTSENWMGIVEDYFNQSMINSIAFTSSVMIPKHIFKTIGLFNEHYNSGEDTDLWIRIALKHPVAFYNKISAFYNLSSNHSITSSQLKSRNHIDFNVFEKDTSTNPSLKGYLDLNRFSMAIQYKLENEKALYRSTIKAINFNKFPKSQKLILKLPRTLLLVLLKLRDFLRKAHIDLRLFR